MANQKESFINFLESESFKKMIKNVEQERARLREQGYSDKTIELRLLNKFSESDPVNLVQPLHLRV
ncbi:hypothetical protein I0P04_001880 [Staphylococcus pseudintermedius]|nr:hypothetical protein [Staphylococcus pseudintermedius]MCE5684578.1 hypothetical protein [Staphylococcus pseudintermedius]HDU1417117.1 hypothetical protein [Staphylococcus pseudintermedius]